MTRKDFVLIANAIKGMELDTGHRRHVAAEMAKALATTNAAFKRDTFMTACDL